MTLINVVLSILPVSWSSNGFRNPEFAWGCGCNVSRGKVNPCPEHEVMILETLEDQGFKVMRSVKGDFVAQKMEGGAISPVKYRPLKERVSSWTQERRGNV